jgi:hypothetical protein
VHDYQKAKRFEKPVTEKAPHPHTWKGVDRAVDELLIGVYDIVLQRDTLIAFHITKPVTLPAIHPPAPDVVPDPTFDNPPKIGPKKPRRKPGR